MVREFAKLSAGSTAEANMEAFQSSKHRASGHSLRPVELLSFQAAKCNLQHTVVIGALPAQRA